MENDHLRQTISKSEIAKNHSIEGAGKGRNVQFTQIKHNKRQTEMFILYEKRIDRLMELI